MRLHGALEVVEARHVDLAPQRDDRNLADFYLEVARQGPQRTVNWGNRCQRSRRLTTTVRNTDANRENNSIPRHPVPLPSG